MPDNLQRQIEIQDTLTNFSSMLFNMTAVPRRKPLDYVIVDVGGPYPERREPRRLPIALPFIRFAPSLEDLIEQFDLIADDPGLRGVVLRIGTLRGGLATLQNVRTAIESLHRRGKRVIAYLTGADLRAYYVASAADEIVMVESSEFSMPGLALEVVFLRDTLARAGIKADFEAISPYKTAADALMRSNMSEAQRETLDAMLDDDFEVLIAEVAEARRLSTDEVRALIDRAVFTAETARRAGLVDTVLYEDELARHLAPDGREGRADAVERGAALAAPAGAVARPPGHRRHLARRHHHHRREPARTVPYPHV